MKISNERELPPPMAGWRWLCDEVTARGDRFIGYDGRVERVKNIKAYADGPRVLHDSGEMTFRVSGYIRRIK